MVMGFRETLKQFTGDSHGGMATMIGLIAPVVATGVMASVEFNNVVATKDKIQNRLDAAALFAANTPTFLTSDAQQDLQISARNRVVEAVASSGINVSDVETDFVYDKSRDRIVGQVTFTPKPLFLGSFFLPDTITVSTEAAPLKPQNVEIALVLDLSGSMNWETTSNDEAPVGSRRVDALRDGVDALFNELEGKDTVDATYAIVPYATSVDLTNLAAQVPAGHSASAYFQNAAGGNLPTVCARQDFGGNVPSQCLGTGNNGTEDPNGSSQTGLWASERFVAHNGNNFLLSLNTPNVSRVPVVTQGDRFDACDDSHVDTFGSRCVEAAEDIHGDVYAEKDYFNTRSGVLGLTSDVEDARDYLDSLEAAGGTAGHLGAIWGLYALTPTWAGVFDHPAGAPKSFDDRESHKIMVVMTDGDFTSTQNTSLDNDDAYDYFQAACALARQSGVEIYAVGFRSSERTDTELTECAGNSIRYYSVDNRAALIRAFKSISDSATHVRLSN